MLRRGRRRPPTGWRTAYRRPARHFDRRASSRGPGPSDRNNRCGSRSPRRQVRSALRYSFGSRGSGCRFVGMMELIDHVRLGPTEAARKRQKWPGVSRCPMIASTPPCNNARSRSPNSASANSRERSIPRTRCQAHSTACGASASSASLALQRRNSGEISCGRNSETRGQTITSASTISIGTSMIAVSLMASRIRIPATAQEIIRHSP